MTVTKELSVKTCSGYDDFLLTGTSYAVKNINPEQFQSLTIKSCLEGYTYPSGTPILTVNGTKNEVQSFLQKIVTLLERTITVSTKVLKLVQTFHEQEGTFDIVTLNKNSLQHNACAYGGVDWSSESVVDYQDVLLADQSPLDYVDGDSGIFPVGLYRNPASEFVKIYKNSDDVSSFYINTGNTSNLETELEQIQWYEKRSKEMDIDIYLYGWVSNHDIEDLASYISGCIIDPRRIPRSGCVKNITSEIVSVNGTPKSQTGVLEGEKAVYWDSSDEQIVIFPDGQQRQIGHNLVRTFYDSGTIKNTSTVEDIRQQTKTQNV